MVKFKSLASAISLTLVASPAFAAANDFSLRSNKAFYPAQVESEKLNKKVSFTFNQTKLSEVLMTIAKAGDFNIVLPQGLDQEINVTITDKRIIEAVREAVEAAGYRYKFQDGTLIVSEIDIGEAEFEHAQILYSKAASVTRALNDEFFKQLIINQPEGAFKPYAFTNPGQNSVTVVGNPEQLEAARRLIKNLDASKQISFYRPGFIDSEDVNYIVASKLEGSSIEVKDVTGAIALKGTEPELAEAVKLLKSYDKPRKPINFYIEILRVDLGADPEHRLQQLQQIFPAGKAQKISSSVAETPEFTSIADYLYRELSEVFLLGAREEKNLPGMHISARKDILLDNQYSIKVLEQKLDHIDKDDLVGILMKGRDLIPDERELAKQLKIQPDQYILVLIQQQ
jgi:hypothetical protein